MNEMIVPGTLLLVGLIGGVGAAATYGTFHYTEKMASKLTLKDLRPALPWEGLPFPIFFYTKPELLADLRK